MNCEDIQLLIQEFHDGELAEAKEAFIFTHMAYCPECRNFLKTLNLLNQAAMKENTGFPGELEKRIMGKTCENKITEKPEAKIQAKHISPFSYVSLSLALLMVIIAIFFFRSKSAYDEQLNESLSIIREQNKKIEMILNSYPDVKVSPKSVNEIIINAKL